MLTMVGLSVVSFPPPRADSVLIVSENCIPLAYLLFAASRLDAWAIVVNPRLHLIILVDSGDHLRSTHLRRERPREVQSRAWPPFGRTGKLSAATTMSPASIISMPTVQTIPVTAVTMGFRHWFAKPNDRYQICAHWPSPSRHDGFANRRISS